MSAQNATLSAWKPQFCTAEQLKRIRERRSHITERLEQLRESGKFANIEEQGHTSGIIVERRPSRTGGAKWRTEEYDAYRAWANRNQLTLEPDFREEDGYIFLPEVYLVVAENLPLDVQAVFPCYDRETKHRYEIEDYLDAVEQSRDWFEWTREENSPAIDPNPIHNNLKKKIKNRPGRWIGEGWNKGREEFSVSGGNNSTERGQIDLIFKHQREEMFLLVEVKTSARGVDRAFGQLLRYSKLFLKKRDIPGLTDEDLELVIAAPEFDDTHSELADALGIRLIRMVG